MKTGSEPVTKKIKVGVFYGAKAALRLRWEAYTVYNKAWPGCCEHVVEAVNSTEAKRLAITECKLHRKV